jgi:hypothetical protein
MNSPFVYMACNLTLQPVHVLSAIQANDIEPGLTRTERIRRLLKQYPRAVTAAEIAYDMGDHFPDFGQHLVWLLLKYEIQKGRVLFADGKYAWSHEYDTAEAAAIRAAVALLTKHGYDIEAPL